MYCYIKKKLEFNIKNFKYKFIIKYQFINSINNKKNYNKLITISVSKLNLKKAVSRNRIKRLIKASLLNNTLIKNLIYKYNNIIIIYIDNKIPQFNIINQCIIDIIYLLLYN
ncbi:MAG: ribonuclease P protein component [Candidatus Bostrichicola ureolyticus]|nr:MAG: ribonuclease P protein component [Candidatus Bostrichicola ureolyticus]